MKYWSMPYLGNKTPYLNFIHKILSQLDRYTNNFLDPMSGTGAVSLLAKENGWNITTNDQESYAHLITKVRLLDFERDVEPVFCEILGKLDLSKKFEHCVLRNNAYEMVLEWLNHLKQPKYAKHHYFSTFFSPADIKKFNKESERFFYTPENALKIDAILEAINNKKIFNAQAKEIILVSLMAAMLAVINNDQQDTRNYQPSISRQNRERVCSELTLLPIAFVSSPNEIAVEHYRYPIEYLYKRLDKQYDVVYLDPPFSGQRYSQNYDQLNLLTLKYRPDLSKFEYAKRFNIFDLDEMNKSDFNSRAKDKKMDKKVAQLALENAINLSSRYILYSYEPNSVLTLQEIFSALSQNGHNHISLYYDKQELNRILNESIRSGEDKALQLEHCLLLVEKNVHQSVQEIFSLMLLMASKVKAAINETYQIPLPYLDVHKLILENLEWRIETDNVKQLYRLFHENKFIFNVQFSGKVIENIDTIFDEADKVIEKYLSNTPINDSLSKNLQNKNGLTEQRYVLTDEKISFVPLKEHASSLSSFSYAEEDKKDIKVPLSDDDLFALAAKKLQGNDEFRKQLSGILDSTNKGMSSITYSE